MLASASLGNLWAIPRPFDDVPVMSERKLGKGDRPSSTCNRIRLPAPRAGSLAANRG